MTLSQMVGRLFSGQVLPLYFPRNKAEQYRAVALLPEDVGNESGETVVAERQVRVGESYQGASTGGAAGLAAPTGYEHDEWFEPEPDPTDLVGGAAGGGGMDTGGAELARYVQLLEAAKEMDLKAIEDRQIIYRAGKDSTGLPVRPILILPPAHESQHSTRKPAQHTKALH